MTRAGVVAAEAGLDARREGPDRQGAEHEAPDVREVRDAAAAAVGSVKPARPNRTCWANQITRKSSAGSWMNAKNTMRKTNVSTRARG